MRLAGVGAGLSLIARIGVVGGCCLALAQCGRFPGNVDSKYGVSASPRVVRLGEPVPKGGGVYRVGKPYTIAGHTYTPEQDVNYSAEGTASWYGEDFHGRLTANGEVFDMDAISAAHPTLPIPSYARVTNLANRRSIIVRVNDRGPYHQGRLIDVSVRTAKLLGFYAKGTARVRVDYVGPASLAGSDDRKLEATLRRGTPAPGPADVRLVSSRPFPGQVSRSASAGPAVVPTPAERPFERGRGEALGRPATPVSNADLTVVAGRPVGAAAERSKTVASLAPSSAASGPRASSFEARFAPAASMPAADVQSGPMQAFAPVGASNGAILTGRGLY